MYLAMVKAYVFPAFMTSMRAGKVPVAARIVKTTPAVRHRQIVSRDGEEAVVVQNTMVL
jgi:hypothetical protein